MRGYGYSLPPVLLMMLTICGVRIGWIYTAFAAVPTFFIIMLSYPISWAVTVVLLLVIYRFYCRNLTVPRRG